MARSSRMPAGASHARILSGSDPARSLDTVQLQRLEESFRQWADLSTGRALRWSRKRILLIFLLIRYTGARLNEVLNLDALLDLDTDHHIVRVHKGTGIGGTLGREVQIPELLSVDIRETLAEQQSHNVQAKIFKVDPGHVRRKFYERAEAAGIPRELGTPEIIRRSRAVELMQSNLPLPVVQKIMGHSTPNLAASYVEFSDDDIREVARSFADREHQHKTSARNAFFGKIERVRAGDVQTVVELVSLGGAQLCAIITNYSSSHLGLKPGALATAEIKAPWVMLFKGEQEPSCSAENRFCGKVSRITAGKLVTEIVVRIPDGTELCSIITEKSRGTLEIAENDTMWVAFSAFAVVIYTD